MLGKLYTVAEPLRSSSVDLSPAWLQCDARSDAMPQGVLLQLHAERNHTIIPYPRHDSQLQTCGRQRRHLSQDRCTHCECYETWLGCSFMAEPCLADWATLAGQVLRCCLGTASCRLSCCCSPGDWHGSGIPVALAWHPVWSDDLTW